LTGLLVILGLVIANIIYIGLIVGGRKKEKNKMKIGKLIMLDGRKKKNKMKKGKLIIEIEKAGDDMMANLKVNDMTIQDVCVAVGTSINKIICDNTDDNDAGRLLMRVQAMRDIACSIGLEKLSKSIDSALEKAEELIANEKEK
jgi:hypothetical protein